MHPETQSHIEARKAILDGIKEELVERLQLDMDPATLEDDTFLFGEGLNLDSIDAMELVIAMQARFGVELREGELASMRTFNTLADAVMSSQSGPNA
jgi:acyl carrier protein